MRPLPMAGSPGSRTIRRGDDRRAAFGGVLIAAGFLASGAISAGLDLAHGGGNPWPSLHLVLAGAAGTAIAAVLPFFTAALTQVAPASRWIRIAAISLVAGGALAAVIGVSGRAGSIAAMGGLAYLAGLGLTAVAVFAPLRGALGRRSGILLWAYGVALAQVAFGVGLATTLVAGWGPVASNWANLKPAHAWLNVFGFLSLVVAATLLHLAPTVVGTRIRPRRTGKIALVGLMAGAPLVAIGFAGGWDAVARIGAVTELVGSTALVIHAIEVQRDRGRWTSDQGWHRFTSLSLLAAPFWFLVATLIAAGGVLRLGAAPAAWSVTLIGVPLILGWIAQVLIGAWTHLVPAIGPGDPVAHAAQRGRLGRWGTPRVVSWNAGVLILAAGSLAAVDVLVAVGGVVIAADLTVALVLLIGSVNSISTRTGSGTVPN